MVPRKLTTVMRRLADNCGSRWRGSKGATVELWQISVIRGRHVWVPLFGKCACSFSDEGGCSGLVTW